MKIFRNSVSKWLSGGVLVAVLVVAWALTRARQGAGAAERGERVEDMRARETPIAGPALPVVHARAEAPSAAERAEKAVESEKADVAEDADETEKAVDAFDALTDRWMDVEKPQATLADVAPFVRAFKAVPKERQGECIHRALNLIPDANVLLLAGVLLDRDVDEEIVQTVFCDILNRDEDVKKPLLQQIYKNKTHPCFADAAWILDVTGETPSP